MQTVTRSAFTAVKTEGGLLPPELLQRVVDGRELPGLKPEEYHLAPSERLNEVISRSWSRCLGVWQAFDKARADLAASDTGTTLTRERWLLILFDELGYGRLPAVRGQLMLPDGEGYSISHLGNEAVPIHLVTFRQELDKRSTVATALKKTPHSLMQEFLNRAPRYQWGMISNGMDLRLLRDNAALRRAAYVEFDLEAIFGGELYAEFTLLWLLCHQSRFERRNLAPGPSPKEVGKKTVDSDDDEEVGETELSQPEAAPCWLEVWQQQASDQGTRALDALRDGVADAIEAFGTGFLKQPNNGALRACLQTGELSGQDYYRQLRRLTYRLIFLSVAEDRGLLFVPGTDAKAVALYNKYYALHRLRARAGSQRGTPHIDLYRQLSLVFAQLRTGYAPLGLPGLGSFLFSEKSTPDLDDADLGNDGLLKAVRALTYTEQNGVRRPVDYRNLDTEELGSVYESLLELHPALNVDARSFELTTGAGSERKTTGSHYTPTSLVECLLDSALEPVIADRLQRAGTQTAAREQAILKIKVLDYAAGSGHMLIGAGRRLATHLAALRSGEEEPTPPTFRRAMRDVVRNCLYAVDLNDMAVELCKVALWLESMEPGKPLSFLDAHIQEGNSLIGVTPNLDIAEIPDDAFSARTGDNKTTATGLKRRNKREREGQASLFQGHSAPDDERLAAWRRRRITEIDALTEESAAEVATKGEAFAHYLKSEAYRQSRLEADLWTAAFFWELPPGDTERMDAPTQALLDALRAGKLKDNSWRERHRTLIEGVVKRRRAHRFFHWAIQFPEVFVGDEGGFDVVLSNPPWEHTELKEKEFFAERSPEIASARNGAVRKRMIDQLRTTDPSLLSAFQEERRAHTSMSHFVRTSVRFPLTGRGRANAYALFSELSIEMVNSTSRIGIIVQSDIATGDTYKDFIRFVVDSGRLQSFYDFVNTEGLFPALHRTHPHFSLFTIAGAGLQVTGEYAFWLTNTSQIADPERRVSLSSEDIALLNPNSHTFPVFKSQRAAQITKPIYEKFQVLIEDRAERSNLWSISLKQGLFNMTSESELFRTSSELMSDGWQLSGNAFTKNGNTYLPLFESKMFHQYDHRWATFKVDGDIDESASIDHSPRREVLPRYWVSIEDVATKRAATEGCMLAYRNITNSTNERTVIASILPHVGVGHSASIISFGTSALSRTLALQSAMNSFVFDFVTRQKIGGANLSFPVVEQLPLLTPENYKEPSIWDRKVGTILDWLLPRVLELTYTAWDLQAFALDCGYHGPPFRWDEERRFLLRAELDAAYFHLYGVARDDVDYIMETFPIVKRKDIAKHGEYRTKRVILEIYDAMADAQQTGVPYATRLDPPPADPRVAHGARQ